jgi:hypothetical protein
MKRLILSLLLIVGFYSAAQAQKLLEFTYKESNHYSDGGAINFHKQSKLVGTKLYFIYDSATDSISLTDQNGKVKIEQLLQWDEKSGCYSGYDWWTMIAAELYEMYYISANGKVLQIMTSDDDGYDIRHHYYLSNSREI